MSAFSESFLIAYNILGLNHQPRVPVTTWLTRGAYPTDMLRFAPSEKKSGLWSHGNFGYLIQNREILQSRKTKYEHQHFHRTICIFYITVPSPYRPMQRKSSVGRKARILCALSISTYRGTWDRGNFWRCFSWRKRSGTRDHRTVKAQSAPGSFQMNDYDLLNSSHRCPQ